MMRSIFIMILSFLSLGAFGQISIAVSADKDTINFGDEVNLTYQINAPQNIEIAGLDFSSLKSTLNLAFNQYPEDLDSIVDIDVVNGGEFKVDNYNLITDKNKLNGAVPLRGTLQLRISSVGVIFLPKPQVIHNSQASLLNLETPMLYIKPVDLAEELNPNFSIIEEQISWKDYLIYAYIYLAFALFALSVYFINSRVKRKERGFSVSKEEEVFPADVIAVRDLKALEEKQLWQNDKTKAYHTELTRIMRQYIEDRYGIQALEMTSSQLKREMTKDGVSPDIISRFYEILLIADKVKFAKGDAGPEINSKFMEEAYAIVEETKEVEKENDKDE